MRLKTALFAMACVFALFQLAAASARAGDDPIPNVSDTELLGKACKAECKSLCSNGDKVKCPSGYEKCYNDCFVGASANYAKDGSTNLSGKPETIQSCAKKRADYEKSCSIAAKQKDKPSSDDLKACAEEAKGIEDDCLKRVEQKVAGDIRDSKDPNKPSPTGDFKGDGDGDGDGDDKTKAKRKPGDRKSIDGDDK